MINVDSVSWALYVTVASDATVVACGTYVELEREVPEEADKTPWIGVYYDGTRIEPVRSAITQPYQAVHSFLVKCQAFDGSDLLEARLKAYRVLAQALTAINSSRVGGNFLDGAADMLTGVAVVPPETGTTAGADDNAGFALVSAMLTIEKRA